MAKVMVKLLRTSTVVNGVNEKGTEILDFEYSFPVDSTTGNNTSTICSDVGGKCHWDSNRPAREAAYGCLDSGQGCGGDEHLALVVIGQKPQKALFLWL